MFSFQVFWRAEAKTFPVDKEGDKREKIKKKKGKEKGKEKKQENIGNESAKKSKFWSMGTR